MKCATETRKALETLRDNDTWACQQCGRYAEDNTQTEKQVTQTMLDEGLTRRELIVMQWNCDNLATKTNELKDVLRREKVDVMAVQETKLGEKDKKTQTGRILSHKKRQEG